ncbi:MAG: hypothetical protein GX442_04580 [Candidatus Riflebacteria bacterium]|nr:hypothetical protein [Candidatus Riflebacteria bacterium]
MSSRPTPSRCITLLAGIAFLLGVACVTRAPASDVAEIVLQGGWGSQPEQLGLTMPAPGMLPEVPFQGPGGFRVDAQGGVWISDSVNRAVKVFREGKVEIFPIPATGLGDLDLCGEAFYVCTRSPDGIFVGRQDDGGEIRRIALACRSPGRLQVVDENRILLADGDGGLWWIRNGEPGRHPAEVMEPVGTAEHVFGIVYDLDESSRSIVRSGWTEQESEPGMFALLKFPKERIAFSRLLGLQDGNPWVMMVMASNPGQYRVFRLDGDGKVVREARLPVLTGAWLPAWWVAGPCPVVYGFRSDPQGFSILRQSLD